MASLSREDDVETVTSDGPESNRERVRALFVTGPSGGRHVLPEGLVTLGRGPEATILVSDPRVSRLHAALHVASEVVLSDLGSANGTFIGTERLSRDDARTLAEGQTFFMGDSALVVRPCALGSRSSRRVETLDEVRRRFAGTGDEEATPMVVVRVRPLGRSPAWILDAILSDALRDPRDFLFSLDTGQLVVGVAANGQADVPHVERALLQKLVGWGIVADLRGRFLTLEALDRAGSGLPALLAGDAPIELKRSRIVLREPAMKELEQAVARVAPASVNVLVLGETGAGKDVIATMIHERSARSDKAFLGLNCASLPESLLESELFGYERGAFTGAAKSKPGLLEAADGGTVFLDEIGDLPHPLQAKLLRVIESQEVLRLGAIKPRVIDVRFVAATNRDLERDAAEGRFRQDLYYRLNSVTLKVPPLRERPLDVEPLAKLFLERACTSFETQPRHFSAAALAVLAGYSWPGNVRELRSVVERAVLLGPGPELGPAELGLPASDVPGSLESASVTRIDELAQATDAERDRIVQALEACGGNQSRAAQMLGVPRRTLVRRIAQLGLPRPRTKG
jgi:two-component system, NtrC family, response regulator AtoC